MCLQRRWIEDVQFSKMSATAFSHSIQYCVDCSNSAAYVHTSSPSSPLDINTNISIYKYSTLLKYNFRDENGISLVIFIDELSLSFYTGRTLHVYECTTKTCSSFWRQFIRFRCCCCCFFLIIWWTSVIEFHLTHLLYASQSFNYR